MMLINNHRLITNPLLRFAQYTYSVVNSNNAILQSQFHQKGLPAFQTPKGRVTTLLKSIQRISSVQEQLQALRKTVLQGSSQNKPALSEYLNTYGQLISQMEGLPVSNEYLCKVAGWYNVVSWHKKLVLRLLESQNQELKQLITILGWMHFRWNNQYGVIDQDIINSPQIKLFYKKLIFSQLTLPELQNLQLFLPTPIYYEKRIFYELYLTNHLHSILQQQAKNNQLDQLIWLIEAYTKNMNDDESVFSLVENYLLQTKLQLSEQSIQRLMRVYELKGKISKPLYSSIIRPYLFKCKMGTIEDVIDSIRFVVCSECQDDGLLKTLYELADSLSQKARIQSAKHLYLLHLYTHYLLVKGYRIRLNQSLQNILVQFCRQRTQSRSSISQVVLQSLEGVSNRTNRNSEYVSPCLNHTSAMVKQQQQTKTSRFQQQFLEKLRAMPLEQHVLYQKPIFCCFELDFCLQNKESGEMHNLEIEGIQYIFKSGKMVRERQIRDEILGHYCISIHHIDFHLIRNRKYSDLEDFFRRIPKL